jgi:methanogenic corrinoid protein MtbC1
MFSSAQLDCNLKSKVSFVSKAKKPILDELYDAVVKGDIEKTQKLAHKSLKEGVSANAALEKMKSALQAVDAQFMRKKLFSADVASSFNAMQAAFKVLKPHLKVKPVDLGGKVVIGALKGNIQGLGKDIVAAALKSAGFQVTDLGIDVSPKAFVAAAEKKKAQVIAVSVSVADTVPFLKELVGILRRKKLFGKVKTVIGGRAVSEEIAKKYGIDAYVRDEWDCVRKVRELLSS